jgi:hypothetical protein
MHRQIRPSGHNRIKNKTQNVETVVAHIKSKILTTRGNQSISYYKKCPSGMDSKEVLRRFVMAVEG